MKVYVITSGEYSDYGICAVTLDKKQAELLKERYSGKWDEARIEEYDTDDYKIEAGDKGTWIYEPNCWLRCSCCGSHFPHTSIYKVKGSKYCPNCGKEMESKVAYD